jgi:antitoxin component of RelBE/YafQ-DinJ toxin-antitoxin module
MSNTTIYIEINTNINAQASHVFSTLKLSTNEAIAFNIPNKETIAAMEDANNRKVECYNSLKSMWADLNTN